MAAMNAQQLDPKHCYEAIKAKDARFDGVFFVGVSSTGVYCRPVCRVRTPRAANCSYYSNAASAEQAGFRPCLRCRPELAPGNSPNDAVKRLAHQAAAQIKAGALIDSNLETLARSFNISDRQLRRAVESEFGVSPIALAQTHRLLLAKQLLTDTQLKIIDVAFASGYASVRRFNDAFRKQYRLSPSDLRKNNAQASSDSITLRLSYRPPFAWQTLIGFLSSRSSEGLVVVDGDNFYSTIRVGDVVGWFSAVDLPERYSVQITIAQTLLPCLTQVIAKIRHLFDLDANPVAIEASLKKDKILKPLVKRTPGLRVPGTLDGFELALRAILGQQVSVKAASTLFRRFVEKYGDGIATPHEKLNRLAPSAAVIAKAELQDLISLGLTQRRAQTISTVAKTLASEKIVLLPNGDTNAIRSALLELPGIGPWTADYIAMRCLADPDALPESDLGLMKALQVAKPKGVLAATESWRPWRSYGAIHLWNHLNSGG
jgi:AraC family transcriptional regulator of adaptative response / DNA-3-methyladenine glycosylase II